MDLRQAIASILTSQQIPAAAPFTTHWNQMLSLATLEQPLIPLGQEPFSPKKARNEDSCSPLSSSTVSSSQLSTSPISSPRRKLPQPIPEEKKDIAYYERRRKNNDAAKRSRDLRRQKEEATMRRAAQLEQENVQLKGQLALMKSEMANIQLLLLGRAISSTPSVKAEDLSV